MSKDTVGFQMAKILKEVEGNIEKITEKDLKKAAQSTKKKLIAYSPKGPNGYSKGWAYKNLDGGYTVYNKAKPGLTHLLNNGHQIKNQYGSYGRVNGDNHMGRAEQEGIQELVNDIQTDLDKI